MASKLSREGYNNYDRYTTVFRDRQDLIFAAYKKITFDPYLAPDPACICSNIYYLSNDLIPALSVLGELLDLDRN